MNNDNSAVNQWYQEMRRDAVKIWWFKPNKVECLLRDYKVDFSHSATKRLLELGRIEQVPSHYCGYALFWGKPLLGWDTLWQTDVHGGLNYATLVADGALYGFDCGHLFDYRIPELRDLEWLTKETEYMASQIARWYGMSSAYE